MTGPDLDRLNGTHVLACPVWDADLTPAWDRGLPVTTCMCWRPWDDCPVCDGTTEEPDPLPPEPDLEEVR